MLLALLGMGWVRLTIIRCVLYLLPKPIDLASLIDLQSTLTMHRLIQGQLHQCGLLTKPDSTQLCIFMAIIYCITGKFRDMKISRIWALGNFATGKFSESGDRRVSQL